MPYTLRVTTPPEAAQPAPKMPTKGLSPWGITFPMALVVLVVGATALTIVDALTSAPSLMWIVIQFAVIFAFGLILLVLGFVANRGPSRKPVA
jgi:uncharacterized membrane protein YedE/YeeE